MSTEYGSLPVTSSAAPMPGEFSSSPSSKSSFLAKIAGAVVFAILVLNKVSGGNQAANLTGWFLDDVKNGILTTDSPTISPTTSAPTAKPTPGPTAPVFYEDDFLWRRE